MIKLLTKGLLRDPLMRRKLMFWITLAAVAMTAVGWVFFSDEAWIRQHFWGAVIFWGICGWLLLTTMLLALFDILAIRAMHRATRRAMEKQFFKEETEGKDDPQP
jgi:hypothetical protein